jgi:4-amino-4-deoxy-L-arabinose transferase-like glycosyltransferase
LTFWPGSLFVGLLLVKAKDVWQEKAARYCIIWLVPIWLVLECIPTKLPHYILPAFPALALLTGRALELEFLKSVSSTKTKLVLLGGLIWLVLGLMMSCAIVAAQWYLNGSIGWPTLVTALLAAIVSLATFELFRRRRLPAACFSSLVAAVCLLAPSLQAIVPGMDAMWLSRSVGRALELQFSGKPHLKPVIAVSGYEEPSIVFALGTNTKLISPAAAAEHMRERDCAAAVITAELRETFIKHLALPDDSVREVASIRGFNYTKGQWTTLRLYVKDKHC